MSCSSNTGRSCQAAKMYYTLPQATAPLARAENTSIQYQKAPAQYYSSCCSPPSHECECGEMGLGYHTLSTAYGTANYYYTQ